FLAASPIKRSSCEKATYDGVVRLPSAVDIRTFVDDKEGFEARTVIGNDFDTVVLPYTNAANQDENDQDICAVNIDDDEEDLRVCSTEINTNGTVKRFVGHFFGG